MQRPLVIAIALSLPFGCDGAAKANPAPAPSSQPETAVAPAPKKTLAELGLTDRGVFSDLNERVELELSVSKRYLSTTASGDVDKDGIPNPLDILIGAKKTVLDAAPYVGGYTKLAYPGGDVPRDEGVCTDVIVRAIRNAGMDLQKLLHEDIRRAPGSYPMVKRADKNIDHRRVKTLLPYFVRHWDSRTTALDDRKDPYLPGDIVFMDTFPSWSGPDHVGIVSDTRGPSGHLLIANSWAGGSHTSELDLLGWVPVTHRFRIRERDR
jgi:uncharacterized protein YijF (DUF1287 family)